MTAAASPFPLMRFFLSEIECDSRRWEGGGSRGRVEGTKGLESGTRLKLFVLSLGRGRGRENESSTHARNLKKKN